MFSSPARSSVLLLVAAAQITNTSTTAKVLHSSYSQAERTINYWERQGVTTSEHIAGQRFTRLDERFYAAAELRDFLETLVRLMPNFQRMGLEARVNACPPPHLP